MSFILTKAKNKYVNIRGFHSTRKLVIIESDDWGSIRMPSVDTFKKIQHGGDKPEENAFLSNDCLENEIDLDNLFEVLTSVRDSKGNPAVITANFATANPDFDKIDYEKNVYAYESFFKTYDRYYPGNCILDTIKKGMKMKCFVPQLHCREHMNVNRWLNALKSNKKDAVIAFENRMIGIGASFSKDNIFGYMDAFNTDCTSVEELECIFKDAVKIFSEVFGYESKTFVASCFVWPNKFEKILFNKGVVGIQSSIWQNVPVGKNGEYKLKRKIHYTGEKNEMGQIYTVRNCSYEPAYYQNPDDCVKQCLSEIEDSFKHSKPAVINSHRFNYISSINPDNGKNNLSGLKKLLTKITQLYDDVEFISTPNLIDIIRQGEV